MSGTIEQAPESPDFFAVPTKGAGTKSVNNRPKIIAVCVVGIILIVLAYVAHVKAQETQQQVAAEAETKKVTSVSVPAVKKPEGPDVLFPPGAPVERGNPYASGQYSMPVDEAAKQLQARKLAALDAALNASAVVEKFESRQQGVNATPTGYGSTAGVRIDGTVPPLPRGQGDEEMGSTDQDQAHKRAFLKAGGEYSPYLNHTRQKPISEFVVNAGFIIPGITISGINSDLPGMIVGQVRQNVFDSATGNHLLIPAGARLVGTYDSEVSGGQERALVAWNRIIFPDSSSVYLETMPGADQTGIAGFKDQVNNHYLRTFGQAFMLSLFSAGMQLSQPRGSVQGTYNAQQIGAAALGQQMAQLGMQLARRNLNRQPTLEVRPGFEFTIMVNKDMVLPVWKGHPQS